MPKQIGNARIGFPFPCSNYSYLYWELAKYAAAILLFLVLLLISITTYSKTYYVANSGNDSNDGLSISTPWNSLVKVSSFTGLLPGDSVVFNRGDVFYGSITINSSGTAGAPITFSAYGSGVNPVVTGFTNVTSWANLGSNIWESTNTVSTLNTCNMVVINGVNTAMGRTPNYPNYYTWISHGTSGSNTNITSNLSGTPNWTGAELAIFTTSYRNVRYTITNQSGSTLTYATPASTDLWQSDPGYFLQQFQIQNDIRTLDTLNEWYYNPSTKKLDVYNTTSPTGVQLATVDTLIWTNNKSYITLTNLTLTGSNKDAISLASGSNLKIINCTISYIGGTAIYGITGSTQTGLRIDSNVINQVNNSGIDLKYWYTGDTIRYNTVKNINMLIGMQNVQHTIFGQVEGISSESDNSVIAYNNEDSIGIAGIHYFGNNVIVDHNYINHSCFGNGIRDIGGIYTWNGLYKTIIGAKVSNNIVLNTGLWSVGIFCDEGANGIEIYNNTSYNTLRGVYLDDSYNINVHNNTTFNTGQAGIGSGFFMNNNPGAPKLRYITVKNNKFIAKTSIDRALWVITTDSASMPMPFVSDSNYFAKPLGFDTVNNIQTDMVGASYVQRTLASWQALNSQDAHSHGSSKAITDTLDFNFQYNPTNSPVTISLPYNCVDITGATYSGSITLQPYTSVVLIRNRPPVANAGTDQLITLPANAITLTGTATDPDGTIASYNWIKISGPSSGTITNAGSASTSVTGLTQGIYLFELHVADNNGAIGKDTVQILVNAPPTANAGSDQLITLPANTVILSGSGADADGTIAGYSWAEISGPASGTITNAGSPSTSVTGLIQGVYQFELDVADNNGAIGKDTVQITVNTPPTANAGADQLITLPINTVTLSGSGNDADGTISSYNWTQISGPASGTITNGSSASTSVTGLIQGVYQFELDVADNNGAIGKDTVQITVNTPPTANAGADQLITLPINTVTLSGSGTDADGTIASYNWLEISGPPGATILNPASAITSATGLVQGVYQFELDVTDNNGAIGKDTVLIIVNTPPTANAGADQLITLPTNIVTLSGSGTDIDGTISAYSWTKISGPASGTIINAGSASTTVTALAQGVYQFQLKVTDNNGATGADTIQITVNTPPTANAGVDQLITLPINTVTLSGTGTDADGTISAYSWTKLSGSPSSGTITNAGIASTPVTALVQGVYKFQLKVTDNNGATGVDTVQITVNAPPTANAGVDQIIKLPTSTVTLSGSGTDVDGAISAYSWTKLSGSPSSGTITNSASASTTVTALVQGVYQFQLKVTDNNGATGVDTVQITVNPSNIAPTANAGPDQLITLPTSTVTLSGSGTDADGTISAYKWTKLSGSPTSGTITSSTSASTTVTALVKGVYKFQLKVTDNGGATGVDTVQITVNTPPTANAGVDQVISLPTTTVTLSGTGADVDGTIAAYSWTKVSGPAAGTITNASTASTTVTALVNGVYKFQLKVTDNLGATGVDTVQITVNAPPTANAGPDQLITLPTSTITLSGSGTDIDGTISAYKWTKISGSTATITNSTSASTTVTALVKGIYKFQLKVTDNNGASGVDTVQITVNVAPVANAGPDQVITLPATTATLAGSGTDADGTISAYNWTKVSGPVSGTITNVASASTTVTSLVDGVYKFQLKVTDNNGATGVDTDQITVNAAPTANAGPDQLINLPTSTVTLSGTGTDVDGTISAYKWTKLTGSPASGTITSSTSASTTVTALAQGVYKFQLKVTDNNGAAGVDTVQITVNTPPTANAGVDQSITLPTNKVTLTGTGTDPDGTISAYNWAKISGPAATIATPTAKTTSVTGLVQGVYLFQLIVTDNRGATGKDTMQVTVSAAALVATIVMFTAQPASDNVSLVWETTNETNVSGFDIEKKTANTWEKMGYMPSTGGIPKHPYFFNDHLPVAGLNYYRLKILDTTGKFVYSDIVNARLENLVHQNVPNPFSETTTIPFAVVDNSLVKIVVYDAVGMPVAVLVNAIMRPGTYQVQWNAGNIASGTYFYTITMGNRVQTKKMLKLSQ